VERVKCSFACRRHTVALLTRRHWRGSSTVHSSARTYAPPLKERTCFDIAWRLPCYAPGRRWEKLERFSGIKVQTRRRSTPRLTSKACAHWLISGRWEVHSEAAGTGIERLRQRSAQLGIPIPDTSKFVTELCGVSPSRGRSEEHTSELQSPYDLVCRLLLEKKKKKKKNDEYLRTNPEIHI